MSSIMDSLRKWFYKPRRDDTSHLAQFFYADEALNLVAAELDSFDGRKDPERCTTLVNHLRQCQDKVLTICNKIMDEMIPNERADRDFRVKFPDDVMQDNLAGQLWFGAECLAAGSSIMNRESESGAMRPLAKALTKSLENVRNLLREAAFRSQCAPPAQYDHQTEILVESLKMFDRLLADFELAYVSAMVPVKSVQEYELQQCVVVLFSETLQRALHRGLLTQEMVDQYDPALMFTIPRLAIVAGLLIYPHGPLSLTSPQSMSDMFRPFRTLLMKIRELLWTLTEAELMTLEKMLCSSEDPEHPSDSRISSEMSNATKDDLDDSMICSKELSDEFDLMMDRKILSRHASDNSSIDSTLTCIERSLQVDDVNSINDNETSSMRRAIMPHLIFLNHMSDEDRSSLQGQDSGSVQNNSDDSLSDQTPEPSDLYKIEGPSTSSDSWTLHVIPCECSYARCSPNCNCATDKDVRWPKSDNTVRTNKCDTVSAQSDQPGCSQGICKHASPSIEQANNNLAGNNDLDDNSVNLNNNFSKEIVGKKLGNLCSSEVVVNGLLDRTSPVDQKWGETSHNLRGKYDENWESLSTMTSSNPQDIRKHTIGSESDASSFSSSCSSCQSTVSAISNSVSTDTSSYNSDCLDDLEVALAMKAAEVTNNKEARAKFRSSADLVHRLFVCISGVADQLQTNFAGDLRNILKAVFLIHASDRNDYETTDDPNNECCERGEDAVVWGERDVESPPAWVPDQAAPTCMSCQLPFTVVRRRHHCRNCGKVFCARCSSNSVPLPRYGHLKPVRVCNRCFIYQVTPFTIDQNIATAN